MGVINSIGVEIPKVLICPACLNNSCLLQPDIFAKTHLSGAYKRYYETMKRDLDDFLKEKMQEYVESIKYSK